MALALLALALLALSLVPTCGVRCARRLAPPPPPKPSGFLDAHQYDTPVAQRELVTRVVLGLASFDL